MPFFYDFNRITTTNGTTNTESTHVAARTIANQETVSLAALYVAARSGTAGGAALRVKHNTGTVYSGGAGATITAKNMRLGAVLVQQSVWVTDSIAITPGSNLVQRLSIGFAQTGGQGGWQGTEPDNRFKMQPNGTQPIDLEITSIANGVSIPIEMSVEFGEGV
jgi:hypothetical protein